MAIKNDGNQMLYCSFCGKSQEQVKRLNIGPKDIHICDECIGVCSEIIEEESEGLAMEYEDGMINLLKPREIKEYIDQYVIGQDEAKRALARLTRSPENRRIPRLPAMFRARAYSRHF